MMGPIEREFRPSRLLALVAFAFATVLAVAASSQGRELPSLDLLKPTEIHELIGHPEPIVDIAFSPDGATIVSAARDATMIFWDIASGEIDATRKIVTGPNADNHEITGIQFGGLRGGLLAASSKTPWPTACGALVVWDVATANEVRIASKVAWSFSASAIQENGPLVAAGTIDGIVRVWDTSAAGVEPHPTDKKKAKAVIAEVLPSALALSSEITAICFHPHARRPALAAACKHGGVGLLTIGAKGPGVTTSFDRFADVKETASGLAWSPDGEILATALPDRIAAWSFDTGKPAGQWRSAGAAPRCVAFDRSGRILAAGYRDGSIRLWDVEKKTELAKIASETGKPVTCLAFSQRNTLLAAGSADTSVRVWELFPRE